MPNRFSKYAKTLTPAFADGLERSGKPVRQHALVSFYHANHTLFQSLALTLPV